MNTPISVLLVFIVCPILAFLFIIRIACVIFSSKFANQIRKHPILHGIWGCMALIGILAFIRGFTPGNPFDGPPDKISSWYVLPPFRLCPPLRAEHGGFYCVATEAPIAVSAGGGFFQIWKLGSFFQGPTSPLPYGVESLEGYEHPIAISPDGNTVAVASDTESGLFVVDWRKRETLWETNGLEHRGYTGKHLVIGNNGKALFAAGAHTVERWDLFTGKNHAVLFENETNQNSIIRFLKISSNGKVLVAGFGSPNGTGPLSFAVWGDDKNEPAFESEDTDAMSVDVSPDGDWLAICKFGTTNLCLLKWRTGEKKEIALQAPNSIASALWSPDGKWLVARVDSWPESIIVYETSNWKPIAHWECPKPGIYYEYFFGNNGTLYQVRGNELNAFDISKLQIGHGSD